MKLLVYNINVIFLKIKKKKKIILYIYVKFIDNIIIY